MNVLVTGAAGFIGYHVSNALLARGDTVCGLDNLNNYYRVDLKQARLNKLTAHEKFQFEKIDLADRASMAQLFELHKFDAVLHMGAQAGVRHSLEQPHDYVDANLAGLVNLLEGCRHGQPKHLVFASSSSVYGEQADVPFRESDPVDHPVSLYAATKKAGELMAHSYSHLYGLAITCLRFFTVYGPWGRPDMAYFKFADAMCAGQPIEVFNEGQMERDFTFIDDVVTGILKVLELPPQSTPNEAAYRIFNLGRGNPIKLMDFIQILATTLGKKKRTWADTSALQKATGYEPHTSLEQGIKLFAEWYLGEWKESQK